MLEGRMAFASPQELGQELPEAKARGWKAYNGVMLTCWAQLMSTPSAKDSLRIVGDLDFFMLFKFFQFFLFFTFFSY